MTSAALPPAMPGWWQRLLGVGLVRALVVGGTVLVIAYLVLTPLVYLLYATFIEENRLSLDSFARAFSAPGTGAMFFNSVVFAGGTTVLSLAVATFLAYVVVRTDVPYRSLLAAVAVIPVVVPNVLYAIAWVLLASPTIGFVNQLPNALFGQPLVDIFSLAGMIWVEGLHNVPLVFLFMVVAFRAMDSSLEESALVSGASHWTVYRRVTVPLLRPALAGAALIVFVKTLGTFETPTILGAADRIFVFVSRIYFEMRDFPYDTGAAGALSTVLIVMALAGTWGLSRVRGDGSSYQTITGKGFQPRRIELRAARKWVLSAVAIYFIVTTGLPLGIMLYNSLLPHSQAFTFDAFGRFSLANYELLLGMEALPRAAWNTLVLSVGTATVIALLTTIAAWVVLRSRYRWRALLDHLTFLPVNFPSLVIGLAISFVYLRNPLPFPVYGTLLILLIAFVTNFLPYGMRYAVSALERITNELEESAEVSGASWWQMMRRIVLPLMLPGLVAGWVFTIIVTGRELSSAILLYTPGQEVLSILVFQLYEEGLLVVTAALGVLLALLFAIVTAVAFRISGSGFEQ